MTKAERSRNLRYKKPALAGMDYSMIIDSLCEIAETCDEFRYLNESVDGSLLDALDGDEDDEFEFRMEFSSLSAEAEQLQTQLYDDYMVKEYFDDCTVSLIGNRFQAVGFDDVEEDYFSLTQYERELACTVAGKRIMRMTKKEMLSTIGQCVGILLSYINVKQKYDCLKTTFDILKDQNMTILSTIKEIEKAYGEADADEFCEYNEPTKKFNTLIKDLPDTFWVQ